MDKTFEKQYAINVSRLKYGKHTDTFNIDKTFFDHFEQSPLKDGYIQVDLDMFKYETHLDVNFHFSGLIELTCDRCLEPYSHPLDFKRRIIYSFDPEMKFEGDEIIYANSRESDLVMVQEFYDFINLAIPLRKVADEDIHICSESVLATLGLVEDTEDEKNEEETPIDPRWEVLRKLKEDFKDK